MKRTDIKSHCPVNYALEIFGDLWSLLIVRDIAFWGKHTYGEFLRSSEGISTNVLAQRLEHLEEVGVISRYPHPKDGRKELYILTDKGVDILPAVLEMAGWSSKYDPLTIAPKEFVAAVYADRYGMFKLICDTVRRGGAVFVGENSVVEQMRQQNKRSAG